jgi:predicted nucleic acid-binding protein
LIVYFDTSSIVALHLAEAGRHNTLTQLRNQAEFIATSRISYAEARAALDFARRDSRRAPRLSEPAYVSAVAALDRDWPAFFRIDIAEDLVRNAGNLAETYHLKGYDAVQLASAIALKARIDDEVLFSTWDRALVRAARREQLGIAHEVN